MTKDINADLKSEIEEAGALVALREILLIGKNPDHELKPGETHLFTTADINFLHNNLFVPAYTRAINEWSNMTIEEQHELANTLFLQDVASPLFARTLQILERDHKELLFSCIEQAQGELLNEL